LKKLVLCQSSTGFVAGDAEDNPEEA
jgi:hypothetical protein